MNAKCRKRRSTKRLHVEYLESRRVLDADLAAMAGLTLLNDLDTQRNPADTAAPETFASADELTQFLRREAEHRYGDLFGQPGWYPYRDGIWLTGRPSASEDTGYSGTNNQVSGVEEADIVKTDGRYLFIGSDHDVVIVDAQPPAEMHVVSRLASEGQTAAIYLSENRLTVISIPYWVYPEPMLDMAVWQPPWQFESELLLSVYDVSSLYNDSPDLPLLISQLEVEGDYVDSRMIGETVFLVSGHAFYLPPPEIVPVDATDPVDPGDGTGGDPGTTDDPFRNGILPGPLPDGSEWVYETREQYWARIGDQVLDLALPNYELQDQDGTVSAFGLLSQPEDTYRPLGEGTDRLVSITSVDVGADPPGIVASTSAPISWTSVVYVSPHNLYLVAPGYAATVTGGEVSKIFQFALDTADGTIPLVARGRVPGHPLNQFSLDEQDGFLRIVTQSGWRTDAESALYVLEPTRDGLLVPAGHIDNLAPGEHLYGVRFMGDRAFVVTFGPEGGNWYDPLFTINLADPHAPRVEGRLQIPGFSNYLQIVDRNFLIGLGRNADETNGRPLEPQLSLFDVTDFSRPDLLQQLSIGSEASWSEAFTDHHAISYFPEYHILAIPLESWTYPPIVDGDGTGTRNGADAAQPGLDVLPVPEWQSALWVFRIDPSAARDPIQRLATIEHDTTVRRSLRLGDALFSLSQDLIQVHSLTDLSQKLGELYYGPRAWDDWFSVDQASADNPLDVLANDVTGHEPSGSWTLTGAGQPDHGGTVTIGDDGLLYTPATDFAGTESFTYTITGPNGSTDEATVTVEVSFVVQEDSERNELEVLAALGIDPASGTKIVSVRADWTGGLVEISDDGQRVLYTPPPDFAGPDRLTVEVGDAATGEVTEHSFAVRVSNVNDNPQAEDDHILLDPETTEAVLWVLANDTAWPDWDETLTITEVGPTTGGGTAQISADGQSILYTRGTETGETDSFTYTISDGHGGTDQATVRIRFGRPGDDDDVENRRRMVGLALHDLAEHLGVPIRELKVVSVEEVVWPDGSLDVPEDGAFYTMALVPGYRITLAHGDTAYVYHTDKGQTVKLAESYTLEQVARIRLEAVDAAGQPISTVDAGQEFTLNVMVEDLRAVAEGVFSAYVDIRFTPRLAEVAGDVVFGAAYPNGHLDYTVGFGLIDELGAFGDVETLGSGEFLLASIPFVAKRAGTASFVMNPAESIGKDVLMYGWDHAVPDVQVELVGTSVEVTGGFHNLEIPTDVNDDGRTTPLDVLTVINALNAFGFGRMEDFRPLLADAAGAIRNHLDVDGDGILTPLDVLMIINEVNASSGSGATNTATEQPLAGWVDWEALESLLHTDSVAGLLGQLSLEPDEVVDLVHEVLVGIDVEALRDFDPNAWASWDADALRTALAPALQTLGVQITADELPLLIDGLTAVVDEFDLGAILPGLDSRLDLTAIETAFRDRFFSAVTDPDFLVDLFALDLAAI